MTPGDTCYIGNLSVNANNRRPTLTTLLRCQQLMLYKANTILIYKIKVVFFFSKIMIEDQDQPVLLFVSSLTLHHTIPAFNTSGKELLKTLWEKEKMLVTSIFSYSHIVLYPSQHKLQYLSQNFFVVCKCFDFGLV